MADTVTTNYEFVKPEVGGSNDTWGTKLNANFDEIDAELFLKLNKDGSNVDDAATVRANLGATGIGDALFTAADAAAARASLGIPDAYWETKAIGELVALQDDLTGVSPPPTDNAAYRYIRLTASDDYNNGVLTGESVSGSAPRVTATAVIDLDGSPMDGETVRLINTERRFLRAGSAGTLQDDEFKSHTHTYLTTSASSPAFASGGAYNNTGTGTTGATGGDETRPRNIGVTYYMRIK